QVETWCPQLPWRKKVFKPEGPLAEVKTDFKQLFHRMASREEFRWMKMRILRMEESWLAAVRSLSEKHNLQGRTRKKILVHLGLLTKESGFKIAESAFSGGPLGELVQWGDVISALYLLGHHIKLSVSVSELRDLGNLSSCRVSTPCAYHHRLHLVCTNGKSVNLLNRWAMLLSRERRCMLRVLDSFGTEPEFNHAQYAQSRGHKTPWGKWSLVPRQFYTMFPHTPDNSFLGFVVEQHLNSSDAAHMEDVKRQNQSLVYGKVDNFWKGKMQYLDIISKYTEIHGTVHGATVNVPPYVKNHGILSGRELQFLLRETKLFVGLGFPYEGPAPLEAIANGCVFLNPRFRPPKSSKNTDFFKGKPTLRELTSQHPYAEVYIGKPHVWTIDIDDPQEVEAAVRQIVAQKARRFMSLEYPKSEFVFRIEVFSKSHNFGTMKLLWPPLSALQVKVAQPGQSCKHLCQESQLICEPTYFAHLNKEQDLSRHGVECDSAEVQNEVFVPALESGRKKCLLQGDYLLFSCAGSHDTHRRICPCRDYMKGQVALCRDCL
uniref:alpha-1,6-mannosyl-glycoprotein 6-beta-N-acetylglucosaminyltransferase n=1 Tax=Petromyzon marinus TaxID=7757 RepID=S4RE96_PETMA